MGSHILPTGVGFTALLGSISRASEAGQSHPLFDDPLAARFADVVPGLGPADPLCSVLATGTKLR